jgi:glycosyltransferase involved in cell wall biosynthesis
VPELSRSSRVRERLLFLCQAMSQKKPSVIIRPRGSRKVLHLLVGLTIGGIENQLLGVLPLLQGTGYRSVVCSLKGEGPLGAEFRGRGIPVIPLEGRGKRDPRVFWRLYRVLRAEKVDLLHCFTTRANWAGAVVGRLARVPVILLSDREIRTWMKPLHWCLDRFCLRVAHGMVVPSEAVRAFDVKLLGGSGDKIWVIPNGVDIEAFASHGPADDIRGDVGLDPKTPLVGYLGRLEDSVKGVSYLLEAMAILRSKGEDLHLLVIGEGPSGRRLREKASLLDLDGSVSFLGNRRDIPHVMKALDLLVVPSAQEGCPNVLLEAMAAGTPIVATRVGGTPELVQHGETGWLVPAADPEGLADGIRCMLRNTRLASKMAQRAKAWVRKNRPIQATVQAYGALYDALLDLRGAGEKGYPWER